MSSQITQAQRAALTNAAMRIMNGTAGGLPRRRIDHSSGSAYVAIYAAALTAALPAEQEV